MAQRPSVENIGDIVMKIFCISGHLLVGLQDDDQPGDLPDGVVELVQSLQHDGCPSA